MLRASGWPASLSGSSTGLLLIGVWPTLATDQGLILTMAMIAGAALCADKSLPKVIPAILAFGCGLAVTLDPDLATRQARCPSCSVRFGGGNLIFRDNRDRLFDRIRTFLAPDRAPCHRFLDRRSGDVGFGARTQGLKVGPTRFKRSLCNAVEARCRTVSGLIRRNSYETGAPRVTDTAPVSSAAHRNVAVPVDDPPAVSLAQRNLWRRSGWIDCRAAALVGLRWRPEI